MHVPTLRQDGEDSQARYEVSKGRWKFLPDLHKPVEFATGARKKMSEKELQGAALQAAQRAVPTSAEAGDDIERSAEATIHAADQAGQNGRRRGGRVRDGHVLVQMRKREDSTFVKRVFYLSPRPFKVLGTNVAFETPL